MAARDYYRDLFENSADAILLIEGDRFVDCNSAAARMLRFPDREALLRAYSGAEGESGLSAHPADMSPPVQPDGRESFEKAEEILELTFRTGSQTFEWAHTCADGEDIRVEVQLTVIRREPKPVLASVWRDISERKRLERELQRAQRMEAVGHLAGGVAHDFNNLLLVVMGRAEMLADELGPGSPDAEHVDGIRAAADRAAELTRQLLSFSRGQPAQMRATDIGALVEDLRGLLKQLTGEHISLELVRPDKPLAVLADPSQLEQIVMNLAANARDAMSSGGTLRISVGRREITARDAVANLAPGGYVGLTVTDSGSGMTPGQLDRALDPFYTNKPVGKGTGLGLATVHAIAEQNLGHASIASSPDVGTTVEVLLPLCDRAPAARREIAPPVQTQGGGETILLVEDEPAIRKLLDSCLQDKRYRVVTAEDGQEALERVERMGEPIDLLVTDVVMPRMSGPELARRLSRTRPRLQVLYMSGYSPESDLGVMAELDDATVLQKPFTPKELQREVRRVLDEARAEVEANDA